MLQMATIMMTLEQYISAKFPDASQAVVAKHLGIGRSYLSLILSGKRTPGGRTQQKIHIATGGIVCPNSWVPFVLPEEVDEGDPDP
jgi:transcriptional regulator with XRE-family HTH domain